MTIPDGELLSVEALGIARERQEGFSVIVAERMLDVVRAPVISEDRMHRVFPDYGWTEAAIEQEEAASDSVARCANAMRVRRDGAPESPIRALITGMA